MPETSKPSGFSFPVWTNGSSTEASPIAPSGSIKRVTQEDDIRTVDVNELRSILEALAIHSHSYYDDKGSC